MSDGTYILFDTESTGTEGEDRILQVGGMIISKKGITVVDELCFPPVEIKIESMEVHGITPDMVAGKEVFLDTSFYDILTTHNNPKNYLVAHNISFDLGMLEKEGFENRYTCIDTLRLCRHLYPDMPYHRLQYLRYALGLYKDEEEEATKLGVKAKAHDAIGDVLVMKLLLRELTKKIMSTFGINDVEKVALKMVELTNTPVLVKTFKFGKYKGELIADVAPRDINYIGWMRGNLDLDEDMLYTLEKYCPTSSSA